MNITAFSVLFLRCMFLLHKWHLFHLKRLINTLPRGDWGSFEEILLTKLVKTDRLKHVDWGLETYIWCHFSLSNCQMHIKLHGVSSKSIHLPQRLIWPPEYSQENAVSCVKNLDWSVKEEQKANEVLSAFTSF